MNNTFLTSFVIFNNKLCVVVPLGVVAVVAVVAAILKRIRPVAECPPEGNLYAGDIAMSSFTRQGQGE